MADRNYAYGSKATSDGCSVSRSFRAFLNSTAKRGPRPGIEVAVYNKSTHHATSDDGDSGIRKAG